jgi:hypothetical protein
MKTYRVSRPFVWFTTAAKVVLTAVAALLYVLAVTQPTPTPVRLLLLAGLTLFGWTMYVRLPRMPTEIEVSDDGWVHFRSRRGTTRVQAADIRSIGRSLGRRTVRVRHAGGRLRLPNRFRGFFDFLVTVKTLNPSIELRGY